MKHLISKIKALWNKLPETVKKPVKVAPYILLAGALTRYLQYLKDLKADVKDMLLMGVINLLIVVLQGFLRDLRGEIEGAD